MSEWSLEEMACRGLEQWRSFVGAGERREAREQAVSVVRSCQNVLKDVRSDADPQGRNKALVFGILFHGLEEFVDLWEITESPGWGVRRTRIEKAWAKMWDCKDRIEYVLHFCRGETLAWVLERIGVLEAAFLADFGPGLYFSPEIVIKRRKCNVCGRDFRSCEHLGGLIYNGVRCAGLPEGVELKSCSVVEVPRDPRCRIWPWQCRKDGVAAGCIMTTFCVDSFVGEPESWAEKLS